MENSKEPTKQELLDACFKNRKNYVYECGQREFDCLISLVEDGTISSWEELAEYGIQSPT